MSEDPKGNETSRISEKDYTELAKLAHEAFCNRRAYEWKIAFGLWAAIGIFTYFAVQNPCTFYGEMWILYAGYCFIGIIWIFFWQPLMRRAFEKDKDWKHYFTSKAEHRPSEETKKIDPFQKVYWEFFWLKNKKNKQERRAEKSYCKNLLDPWSWVQIVPTLLFLAGSLTIIANTRVEKSVRKDDRATVTMTLSGENLQKVLDKILK